MTDFIHAEWELRRLRRLASAAFAANRPFVVSKLEGLPEERFEESAFSAGTFKQALARLAAKGHTIDVLDGQTLLMQTAAFESFDKRVKSVGTAHGIRLSDAGPPPKPSRPTGFKDNE